MEDLQALWNKAARADQAQVDRETLQRIISRKSCDELAKFKRVVVFELGFTVLLVIGLGIWAIFAETLLWPNSLLILFCGFLCWFYWRTLRQYRRIHVEDNLKKYLRNAVSFLKKYIRQYILLSWIGGVVGLMIGFGFSAEESMQRTAIPQSFDLTQWLVFLGIITALLAFSYLYIRQLYRKRLTNLQQLLDELREE